MPGHYFRAEIIMQQDAPRHVRVIRVDFVPQSNPKVGGGGRVVGRPATITIVHAGNASETRWQITRDNSKQNVALLCNSFAPRKRKSFVLTRQYEITSRYVLSLTLKRLRQTAPRVRRCP